MSFYKPYWWKEAVGYQIYLKSFKDSNDDGIGDINGIREKLDYLKDLGVTLLWICPFYKSPMDDNGYDVSDYYDIDPSFGTLDDMKLLIKEAHEKGIRIIADFVMNQTSDEHDWFIESRSSKDNPYRDYYIWKDGKVVDGKMVEPTNWASFFGGSCWQYDEKTNQYYMKIFSNKMPDLNWANPQVRKSMQDIARFWLDLGIDGFRVDAVAHIGRSETFTDSTMEADSTYKPDWRKFSNLPNTHDYLREFNEQVFSKYDIMTVGEVGGGMTPKEALDYAGIDRKELNMVFTFDHCWSNNVWDLKHKNEPQVTNLINLKKNFNKWQTGQFSKSWNPLYWLNHDHPRLMSQYGNIKKPFISGTMLAQALYLMWGTPFIYQGEELGMVNYPFKHVDDFADVSIKNLYEIEVIQNGKHPDDLIFKWGVTARDNARTVMSWDGSLYGGFSNVKPWFHNDPNYRTLNAENALKEPKSIYKYYQKIFSLRQHKKYKNTLIYGSYKQLNPNHKHVYAYLREKDKLILTVTNFFDTNETIYIRGYEVIDVLLSNYDDPSTRLTKLALRPYEAITFLVRKKV